MSSPRHCAHVFVLLTAIVAMAALEGATPSPPSAVRLALVNVPDEVLQPLLPEFQKETGLSASIVYTGRDPFGVARDGKADLVVSHYGHESVEAFVTGGYGVWPRAVFANSIALLGPKDDPAHVRGLTDAVEAFRRIARSKSRFMVNNSAGVKYVEDIVASASGEGRDWDLYTDTKLEGPEAARAAAQMGAYVMWGLPPFLRSKRRGELKTLEALVIGPALFQRIMVSIVVNPAKVSGVNVEGARAFERFLLSPRIQAAVEAFRYPDFPHQAWWAAGRHNATRE